LNEVPIITAGCMFLVYTKIRHLKGGFITCIQIHVQNNCICYVLEDHKNVGWRLHPPWGPPVGQSCSKIRKCRFY